MGSDKKTIEQYYLQLNGADMGKRSEPTVLFWQMPKTLLRNLKVSYPEKKCLDTLSRRSMGSWRAL
jgi:hypothetical protein